MHRFWSTSICFGLRYHPNLEFSSIARCLSRILRVFSLHFLSMLIHSERAASAYNSTKNWWDFVEWIRCHLWPMRVNTELSNALTYNNFLKIMVLWKFAYLFLIFNLKTMKWFHAHKTVTDDNCNEHQMGKYTREYFPWHAQTTCASTTWSHFFFHIAIWWHWYSPTCGHISLLSVFTLCLLAQYNLWCVVCLPHQFMLASINR